MTQPHLTLAELEAGLEDIRRSPRDGGVLRLIVRRPREGEREVLSEAELDPEAGLVGDNWSTRGSSQTGDGSAHPDKQLNVMNVRAIAWIAQELDRWALAGDQLYMDLDLGHENLPTGTRLEIGNAVVEITAPLHLGCQKFAKRFGADALRFVRSPEGRELRLRGVNTRVVRGGKLKVGDVARKIAP